MHTPALLDVLNDGLYTDLINQGLGLLDDAQLVLAVKAATQAFNILPQRPEAFILMARIFTADHDYPEGAHYARLAVERSPDNFDALYMLAHLLIAMVNPVEGKSLIDSMLERAAADKSWISQKNHAMLHALNGSYLCAVDDMAGAAEQERLANLLCPEVDAAPLSPAWAKLAAGEYCPEAWIALDEKPRDRYLGRECPIPEQDIWDGSPLNGRTILLYGGGGLGDVIQFMRYAPMVKASGCRVVAIMDDRCAQLFHGCAFLDELIPSKRVPFYGAEEKTTVVNYDVALPVFHLPMVLKTTIGTIPPADYLPRPSQEKMDSARQRVGMGGFRIGLSWAASDPWRSFPLKMYAALASLPGVRLFGLQRGTAAAELGAVDFPITNLEEADSDLPDTVASMLHMDLVITADTMTCHLAGSFGVPTFTIIPTHADWRWMQGNKADTPWYPTMRLFHQAVPGDWTKPIGEAVEAARALAEGSLLKAA